MRTSSGRTRCGGACCMPGRRTASTSPSMMGRAGNRCRTTSPTRRSTGWWCRSTSTIWWLRRTGAVSGFSTTSRRYSSWRRTSPPKQPTSLRRDSRIASALSRRPTPCPTIPVPDKTRPTGPRSTTGSRVPHGTVSWSESRMQPGSWCAPSGARGRPASIGRGGISASSRPARLGSAPVRFLRLKSPSDRRDGPCPMAAVSHCWRRRAPTPSRSRWAKASK